jgi:uracil-DNA glycosylase family 4
VSPYLLRQIELIQPKLIVAMGRFAAQTLLETDASIASLRGVCIATPACRWSSRTTRRTC